MTDTKIVERAADGARDTRGRALLWVFVAIALAGLMALAVAYFASRAGDAEQNRTISALEEQAATNARSARVLADQVEQLGAVPVVEPPAQADGVNGRDGTDGRDGLDGKDGKDGQTPPCLTEPAQCRGTDGANGVDGASGAHGTDGADGQDGAAGQPGRDGTDGQPPASWTWIDDSGRTQSCARDPDSPDAAPTYTCTAEPPPETVPGPPLPIGDR